MCGVSLNCANFKVYFLLSTVVNQSQQIGFCLKACTLYIFTSKFCLTILQHINFFKVELKLIFSLPTKVNWLISLCFCVWKRILCILIHLKILTNYKNTHCMPVFPTCNVLPWNEIKCNFFTIVSLFITTSNTNMLIDRITGQDSTVDTGFEYQSLIGSLWWVIHMVTCPCKMDQLRRQK